MKRHYPVAMDYQVFPTTHTNGDQGSVLQVPAGLAGPTIVGRHLRTGMELTTNEAQPGSSIEAQPGLYTEAQPGPHTEAQPGPSAGPNVAVYGTDKRN